MARFVPEIDSLVIPAGSLVDEIPIKPQARIFWDSRADCSCDGKVYRGSTNILNDGRSELIHCLNN